MANTFGLLGTAYSGLAAARAALDVTGQNVANVNTAGYTRQRVDLAAVPGSPPSLFSTGAQVGAGVTVLGVSRLNDSLVDARVRSTASTSGYWDTAASALSTVETSLNEPGANGLSSSLNDFWADWQGMANNPGSAGQANVLLGQANLVASRIADGYTAAANAWADARSATVNTVTTVNQTATQIAALNKAIMTTTSAGGNANELIDQRATALTSLAQLTGATSRDNANGTIDVLVGGNALVSGTTARSLQVAGATDLAGAAGQPVHLEWTNPLGTPATVDGGQIAANLATLAGPDGNGTGGIYAETAQVYNDLATNLATQVNNVHATGTTSTGAPGGEFFHLGAGVPALSLSVVPKDVTGIAAANGSLGTLDGSVADSISKLGGASGSPDAAWASFVSRLGAQSKNAATQSTVAASAATAATTAQTSQSGVDLDEETSNLVLYQHAYQAAARVLTAVDQMLDTLINRTGVGT